MINIWRTSECKICRRYKRWMISYNYLYSMLVVWSIVMIRLAGLTLIWCPAWPGVFHKVPAGGWRIISKIIISYIKTTLRQVSCINFSLHEYQQVDTIGTPSLPLQKSSSTQLGFSLLLIRINMASQKCIYSIISLVKCDQIHPTHPLLSNQHVPITC